MSSLKQIEANRRNALKSTGPTTFDGKMRSRLNAVRHGLTAETVISTLEDAEDYQAFEANVTSDYEPESAGERELVLRLASILWRLRRATGIESALFESVTAELDTVARDPSGVAEAGDGPDQTGKVLTAQHSNAGTPPEPRTEAKTDIADAFLRLASQPTFAFDRLSRYEHLLWRQARQIVLTLESLRRRKREPRRPTFPFSLRGRAHGE